MSRFLPALLLIPLFPVTGEGMEMRGIREGGCTHLDLSSVFGRREYSESVILEEVGDRTTGCYIEDVRKDAERLCSGWARSSAVTTYLIDYHGTFRLKGGLGGSEIGAKKKCTYNIRVGCIADYTEAYYYEAPKSNLYESEKLRRDHWGDSFYMNPRGRELGFKAMVGRALKAYLRKLQTEHLWMQRVHNTAMKHQIEKDFLLSK